MLRRSHTIKSVRFRERRRKILIGKVVLVILGAGVLWGLVFWLTGLPVITISAVSVSGNVSVSPYSIASSTRDLLTGRYWFTVPRSNILFYPKESIIKNILESYPRIKNVEVEFKNFHTVSVAITERETAALWCRTFVVTADASNDTSDECFLLDSQGFIFDSLGRTVASSVDVDASSTAVRSLPLVKFYGGISSTTDPVRMSYSSAEHFQESLLLADNPSSLGVNVVAFRERPDRDLDVELVGETRLVIGRESDNFSVMSNFQSVISEPNFDGLEGLGKIDYIDMRFGNKVFYLFK